MGIGRSLDISVHTNPINRALGLCGSRAVERTELTDRSGEAITPDCGVQSAALGAPFLPYPASGSLTLEDQPVVF